MQIQGKAQRVSIYIGEDNRSHGSPLYIALLEYLRREGASGATVLRGLAGFGAHSRIHTANIVTLSTDLPIVLVWIDPPEKVAQLLPQVRRMVNDGLITVEEVDVLQYAPGRTPDPLAQSVHQVMRGAVVTVSEDTPVTDLVAVLLQRGYRSLPVLDAQRRLVGIITEGDLLRRAGLLARLDLQTELLPAQIHAQIETLLRRDERAADIMTQPVVTAQPTESLRQIVERMARSELKRLPVVDAEGHLLGLISRIDILRAVEYHQAGQEREEERPARGATVAELMYRDVPTVGLHSPLGEIIQALEANRRRRAVVVDGERHALGIISDGDLLRRSRQNDQPDLLGRLRRLITGERSSSHLRFSADETAAMLMTTPVITIPVDAPLSDALRLMVQHGVKRLPVVDGEGRLAGLLGRASVLSGLLGETGVEQAA